jgi:uncharacterized YigZ family protein
MLDGMPSYRTLTSSAHLQPPPIKGSKFIGDGAPVHSEEEAKAFIQHVQGREQGASHHCFAWRLGEGDQGYRASDDGEPGGTAGLPILARIDGAELRGVVVVVTRYFGGTKLGRGGLIRAYGGTAGALLAQASITRVQECQTLSLDLDYGDQGLVQGVLRSFDLQPITEDFSARVHLEIAVPVEQIESFSDQIRDRTSGRVLARLPHLTAR